MSYRDCEITVAAVTDGTILVGSQGRHDWLTALEALMGYIYRLFPSDTSLPWATLRLLGDFYCHTALSLCPMYMSSSMSGLPALT